MDLCASDAAHIYAAGRDIQVTAHAYAGPVPAVRTLPRDTTLFTGRRGEVARLLAAASSRRSPGIHLISGMPGVGKTTLAVHVAHRLAGSFPSGQLFVRLDAHTPGRQPADPADVLAGLLVGMGVEPRHVPHGLDARSRLWRDRLAGRRMLIVLDDAVSRAQVDPLLPGEPDCLVLITSRRRLPLPETSALPLDTLPDTDAGLLFARLAGRDIGAAETDTLTHITELCGHLPLAISLLASRLAHRPHWDMARFAHDLAAAQDRLDALAAGELATATAFAMSYDALPAGRRRLFRQLGLHPGPDIDAHAAAALADIPLATARCALEALYDDHLAESPTPGRYRLHDLIRAYARNTALTDPPAEHEAAVERVMTYYAHAAAAARCHLTDRAGARWRSADRWNLALPRLNSYDAAAEWMRAELANLGACALRAIETGDHTHTVRLAEVQADALHQHGRWREAGRLHQAAARAAVHLQDRHSTVTALRHLGRTRSATGNYREAAAVLRAAAQLCAPEEVRMRADVLCALGQVHFATGTYGEATGHTAEALSLYRAAQDRLGEANALWDLGRVHDITSDFARAGRLADRALGLYRSVGHRPGEARTLWLLSRVRHMTGHYAQADELAHRALLLYRALGDRAGEADTLWELGRVGCGREEHLTAGTHAQQALDIYLLLGDRLGEASALWLLSRILHMTGQDAEAEDLARQALDRYGELGNRHGAANALLELGRVKSRSGQHAEATRLLHRSRELFQATKDMQGEAEVLNSIGDVLQYGPRAEGALTVYERALRLALQANSPKDQAQALEGAARCHERAGERNAALACWAKAITLRGRMDIRPTVPVSAVLASLSAVQWPSPCP